MSLKWRLFKELYAFIFIFFSYIKLKHAQMLAL